MKNIQEAFETLGLNGKEQKIVLALVARETTTVSRLGRMIRVPRTTLIPILRKLEKRGFVKQVLVGAHKEWRIVPAQDIAKKLEQALVAFKR